MTRRSTRVVAFAHLLVLATLARHAGAQTTVSSPLSGYSHRSWTAFDDLHQPNAIRAITQDKDGYIWVGFLDGLVRFDGARFIGWNALRRPALPTTVITSLVAGRDGSLWIGFGNLGGVARYKDGGLHPYQPQEVLPAGAIRQLLEDHEGTIWAAGYSGLARFRGDRWERLETAHGLPRGTVHLLYEDPQGRLWVGKPSGLFRREAGHDQFERVGAAFSVLRAFGEADTKSEWKDFVHHLVEHSDPVDPPPFFRDRKGNLWTQGRGGLMRVRPTAGRDSDVDYVRSTSGLTSDHVLDVFEDRDGNIWVGTEAGLDIFAVQEPSQIMSVTDLAHRRVTAVTTGRDGTIWAGTSDGLYESAGGRSRWYSTRDGLPSAAIRALHVDAAGALWVATERGAARFGNGRFTPIPVTSDMSFNRVVALTTDPEGTLWLCDYDALFQWKNGVATRVIDPTIAGRPSVAYADSRGRVWIGFWDGGIVVHRSGRFDAFPTGNGLARGRVTTIYEDSAQKIWVGTLGGFSRFDEENGRFVSLPDGSDLSRLMVQSVVEDNQRRLWIRALSGLVRFARDDFDKAVRDPAYRIEHHMFPPSEGLDRGTGAGAGHPSVTKTKDGLLWFARVSGVSGVAVVDPMRIHETPAPPLRVERILADDRMFEPRADLDLPVNTARVQIDYASLAFAAPTPTRFRYKLDGFDREWVDAGLLRQAFYTNLPPRHYTFRVAATQDGGSWNETTRPLEFSVLPAFYQTNTFYMLSALATGLLLWGAWRWRLHAIRRQYALVIAERARLGREIHDTLLQGMVGVALEIHGISETIDASPSESIKTRLGRARRRLEHYIRETRVSILDLRSPTLETRDLPSALRDAGETLTAGSSVQFQLELQGRPVRCEPRVEEHLLRIAHEAIVNAMRHAAPTKISVTLSYEPGSVSLRVRDNGHGFNPEDVTHRTGQTWGLTSMRERAQQIGARFRCASSLNGGTEIETVAPLAAT